MKHLKTYNLFETVGRVWSSNKLKYDSLCQELNDMGHELDDFSVWIHENPHTKFFDEIYPAEIRVSIYDYYDSGNYRPFNYTDVMEVVNRMFGFMKSEKWKVSSNKCIRGDSWIIVDLNSLEKYTDIDKIEIIFTPETNEVPENI